MPVRVRDSDPLSINGKDLKDDGSLAKVVAWPGSGERVGRVVQRSFDDLIFIGRPSRDSLPRWFRTTSTLGCRLRILEAPAVLEITE